MKKEAIIVIAEWERQKTLFPSILNDGWMELAIMNLRASVQRQNNMTPDCAALIAWEKAHIGDLWDPQPTRDFMDGFIAGDNFRHEMNTQDLATLGAHNEMQDYVTTLDGPKELMGAVDWER